MILRPDNHGHRLVITVLAALAAALAGCGSGALRRAADQPPVLSQYKGWTISMTPSRIDDLWRARIRVWPPEVRPETHPGINVRFSGASTNHQALAQAATAAAREYIDGSMPAQGSNVPNAAEIPANQPPVLSEYKGWTIGVTPSRMQDTWWARVRVWPPEVRPEVHPGIGVSFNGTAAERSAVEQAATAAARRYIDASISVHPR